MRAVCITASPERRARAAAHFAERDLPVQFFRGIDAPRLGIETTLPYEVETGPGRGAAMASRCVGCWLSHRALWASLLLLPDERFLVLEDDARLPEDWRPRAARAAEDAGQFDMLFVGSCCTWTRARTHVAGEVYDVRWPFCTHGYVVRRGALETLIETQDEARCYAPVDISLAFHSFGRLGRVYTVLPRILGQHDTFLEE